MNETQDILWRDSVVPYPVIPPRDLDTRKTKNPHKLKFNALRQLYLTAQQTNENLHARLSSSISHFGSWAGTPIATKQEHGETAKSINHQRSGAMWCDCEFSGPDEPGDTEYRGKIKSELYQGAWQQHSYCSSSASMMPCTASGEVQTLRNL